MQQVTIQQAKVKLNDLVVAAVHGEEILITNDEQQTVQLVPRTVNKRTRSFGCAKGLITMSDDFDAELPDFKEYME